MVGNENYIFDLVWGGGVGSFFSTEIYLFVTKSFGDPRMNLISLACNIFLCFVLLCTIFISSAKTMLEIFFRVCPAPPSKIKWSALP